MAILRTLLIALVYLTLNNTSANSQSFQWLSRIGGPSYDPSPLRPDELVNDVATDEQGNVYVCGRTRNNSNINGIPFNTYGGNDIYLAKFDCNGSLVWVKVAGNPDDGDNGISLALDGLGSIYITGNILGDDLTRPITFFDTVLHVNVNGMFLAKLDTSGNFIWGKIGKTASYGEKIVIDSGGKIVLLLNCPMAGEIFPGVNVERAFYIARFDPQGNIERMLQITEGYSGGFNDMKISSNNEFYFVGDYPLDSNIIGGVIFRKISPTNSYDFFCIKLDTSGVAQWYIHYGLASGAYCYGYGCDLDVNGDLFITGGAYNGLVLGSDTMRNALAPTSPNDFAYVAKVNSHGQVLWARNLHAGIIARSTGGVTVKSNGNAVISGAFLGQIIIGQDTFASSGASNLFAAEFSNNGTILGAEPVPTVSGGSDTEPRRTVCDAADNIIFAGAFSGNLIIDGNLIPYAGGYTDGFIIKWGSALCTVGIEDNLASHNRAILVYPNPAVDNIRFRFSETLPKESKLRIYDVMGREVREILVPAHTAEQLVELHELSPGLYYYALHDQKLQNSGKFIVAKD